MAVTLQIKQAQKSTILAPLRILTIVAEAVGAVGLVTTFSTPAILDLRKDSKCATVIVNREMESVVKRIIITGPAPEAGIEIIIGVAATVRAHHAQARGLDAGPGRGIVMIEEGDVKNLN